ncbi:MAG: Maf family nucleotide pyrophosphatase [Bacteroidota bacterium]
MIENPLAEKLRGHKLILASGSPRRKQFLTDMGLPFEILKKEVEEIYPDHLQGKEISEYLAKLKAEPFQNSLNIGDIVLTSDTVVWNEGESLAKAETEEEAVVMLQKLSGKWHDVITSVCLTSRKTQRVISETTKVKVANLSLAEILFYIASCQPFDKAGAYGIQEWLGLIGISEIQGSYTNVVGLPTYLVYKTLMDMVG